MCVLCRSLHGAACEARGSRGIRSFFRTVEDWHRWLGASNEHRAAARAVTGACNLGFLFLVVTGPFLWIPRKWPWQGVRAVLAFRSGLSGRAQDFNWHNVIGIRCAAPLFLIVLSGVVMSYPWATNLLYRVTGNEPPAQAARLRPASPHQAQRPVGQAAAEVSLAGFSALWRRAEQQVPGWQSLTLRLPASRGATTFTIDEGNGGRPDQRSQLTLNSQTAELVRWEPFSSNNAGRRLRSWSLLYPHRRSWRDRGTDHCRNRNRRRRHACLERHLARLPPPSSFVSKARKGANASQGARPGVCDERKTQYIRVIDKASPPPLVPWLLGKTRHH